MRILIADDHGIVREGLRSLLEKQEKYKIVGEAADGAAAVKLAKEVKPDVIIMDISMPNLNGIQATRLILEDDPDIGIVALSMYYNRRFAIKMLKAGAKAYVLKSYLFDELTRALEAVSKNEHYLSPRITDILLDEYASVDSKSGDDDKVKNVLSERERNIVRLLSEGQSIKEIAAQLDISPKTADANRRQIMHRLGVDSIAELTKYAIREGLSSAEL